MGVLGNKEKVWRKENKETQSTPPPSSPKGQNLEYFKNKSAKFDPAMVSQGGAYHISQGGAASAAAPGLAPTKEHPDYDEFTKGERVLLCKYEDKSRQGGKDFTHLNGLVGTVDVKHKKH